MKKFLFTIIAVLAVMAGCMVNAYAYNVGDKIGEILYTDIVARINDYDIAAFNYNGYTMVVAEDLRNYGFNVEWNEYDRTLSVKRNPEITYVASTYTAPAMPVNLVGKKSFNVLYTDIRTFVEGTEVPSYNINGSTVINLADLAVYGEVLYDNTLRRLELNLYDGLAYNTTEYDEAYYYNRIISMKCSYPDRMKWTMENGYEWKAEAFHMGFGCSAFAYLLSDAAFDEAPARIIYGPITMDMLRVGDILRINDDSHSVVVLEVHPEHVIIAEGNYTKSVRWGRKLTKQTVEAATYIKTRYREPEVIY